MRRISRASRPLLALVAALTLIAALTGVSSARSVDRGHRGHRAKSAAERRALRHVGVSQSLALGTARKARQPRRHAVHSSAAAPEPLPPGVLFRGDQISDFWLAQSGPGAITEVPDPAGSGEGVFKMTVSDSDVYPITPTENPRAEMLSPNTITGGQELWWSTKFFLPAEFPSSTPDFVTLLQGPYGKPWDGTPPFHIEENGGVLKWQRNQTYDWDVPWQMPLVRNAWVSVMVHERFASDGWLELWINGQPITFFSGDTYNPNDEAPTTRLAMETEDGSNDASPNSIYLQQYRKKGMFSSLTTYEGPLTIGTTREAVGG
jgi:hypothetical protein